MERPWGRDRERKSRTRWWYPWLLCKWDDEQSSACKHQIKVDNAVSFRRVVAHENAERQATKL